MESLSSALSSSRSLKLDQDHARPDPNITMSAPHRDNQSTSPIRTVLMAPSGARDPLVHPFPRGNAPRDSEAQHPLLLSADQANGALAVEHARLVRETSTLLSQLRARDDDVIDLERRLRAAERALRDREVAQCEYEAHLRSVMQSEKEREFQALRREITAFRDAQERQIDQVKHAAADRETKLRAAAAGASKAKAAAAWEEGAAAAREEARLSTEALVAAHTRELAAVRAEAEAEQARAVALAHDAAAAALQAASGDAAVSAERHERDVAAMRGEIAALERALSTVRYDAADHCAAASAAADAAVASTRAECEMLLAAARTETDAALQAMRTDYERQMADVRADALDGAAVARAECAAQVAAACEESADRVAAAVARAEADGAVALAQVRMRLVLCETLRAETEAACAILSAEAAARASLALAFAAEAVGAMRASGGAAEVRAAEAMRWSLAAAEGFMSAIAGCVASGAADKADVVGSMVTGAVAVLEDRARYDCALRAAAAAEEEVAAVDQQRADEVAELEALASRLHQQVDDLEVARALAAGVAAERQRRYEELAASADASQMAHAAEVVALQSAHTAELSALQAQLDQLAASSAAREQQMACDAAAAVAAAEQRAASLVDEFAAREAGLLERLDDEAHRALRRERELLRDVANDIAMGAVRIDELRGRAEDRARRAAADPTAHRSEPPAADVARARDAWVASQASERAAREIVGAHAKAALRAYERALAAPYAVQPRDSHHRTQPRADVSAPTSRAASPTRAMSTIALFGNGHTRSRPGSPRGGASAANSPTRRLPRARHRDVARGGSLHSARSASMSPSRLHLGASGVVLDATAAGTSGAAGGDLLMSSIIDTPPRHVVDPARVSGGVSDASDRPAIPRGIEGELVLGAMGRLGLSAAEAARTSTDTSRGRSRLAASPPAPRGPTALRVLTECGVNLALAGVGTHSVGGLSSSAAMKPRGSRGAHTGSVSLRVKAAAISAGPVREGLTSSYRQVAPPGTPAVTGRIPDVADVVTAISRRDASPLGHSRAAAPPEATADRPRERRVFADLAVDATRGVIYVAAGCKITARDATGSTVKASMEGHSGPVVRLVIHRGVLHSAGEDGKLFAWPTPAVGGAFSTAQQSDGVALVKPLRTYTLPECSPVLAVTDIAFYTRHQRVSLRQAARDGLVERIFRGHDDEILDVAVVPTPASYRSAAQPGAGLRSPTTLTGSVAAAASRGLDPAHLAVTGSKDGTCKVFDCSTGACVATLKHGGAVHAVRSISARTLAEARGMRSSALDATADEPTGSPVSLDDTHILTAATDGMVRVWTLSTFACLRVLRTGLCDAVAVRGSEVITASSTRSVSVIMNTWSCQNVKPFFSSLIRAPSNHPSI